MLLLVVLFIFVDEENFEISLETSLTYLAFLDVVIISFCSRSEEDDDEDDDEDEDDD